jgi:mRNA interferase MazF
VRSGDVVRVDFGLPVGSTPGLVRPAIVVTANQTLTFYSTTLHVVPVTTNVGRQWSSDVGLADSALPRDSVAQCHLCAVIDSSQIVEEPGHNIGAVYLAQIRSVLADLLDLP